MSFFNKTFKKAARESKHERSPFLIQLFTLTVDTAQGDGEVMSLKMPPCTTGDPATSDASSATLQTPTIIIIIIIYWQTSYRFEICLI